MKLVTRCYLYRVRKYSPVPEEDTQSVLGMFFMFLVLFGGQRFTRDLPVSVSLNSFSFEPYSRPVTSKRKRKWKRRFPLRFLVYSFFLNFWRTWVLYVGPLIPIFVFWWCLLWVSKPEWATIFELGGGICLAHSLRFTSGAIPAYLLAASMAAEPSLPHTTQCEIRQARRSTDWAISARFFRLFFNVLLVVCCLIFSLPFPLSLGINMALRIHLYWSETWGWVTHQTNPGSVTNSVEILEDSRRVNQSCG